MIPTVDELKKDPSFPTWGKVLVYSLEHRDPVDALNVLDAVRSAWMRRVEQLLDSLYFNRDA